jgi:hypothetical protein
MNNQYVTVQQAISKRAKSGNFNTFTSYNTQNLEMEKADSSLKKDTQDLKLHEVNIEIMFSKNY